jgi:type I restriction enzyme, R subunit
MLRRAGMSTSAVRERPRNLFRAGHRSGQCDAVLNASTGLATSSAVCAGSALLDEIIAARKAKAIEYEAYLKRIAELASKVQAGQAEDTPKTLNTPGRRALYNNLNQNEPLALQIDEAVKRVRPADWRGHQARENQIKREALLPLLGNNVAEVERIFLIIKQQAKY